MSTDRHLRIVAHNGAPEWGGAEIALADLLAGLSERGHNVTLFCNRPLVAERATARGVETRLLRLGADVALHDALRLNRELRRERPHALVVGTFRKLWLAALAGRMAKVPRVVARIGLSTDTPRSAKYRFVLKRWVGRVVFVADSMREAYGRAMPELEDRYVTIYKGLPPLGAATPRVEARRALGVPTEGMLVGGVGRLVPQKRFDRFLDVVAALDRPVHAVLAGDGPLREELESRAGAVGLSDRVRFLGHRDDVALVMDALDLLLITSDREGMAGAMLEALSRGVPVVSTDVSGAREGLEAGPGSEAPGLITGHETHQITAAVARLLGDAALRATMGRAARERYRERFSFDRMLDAWEAVLGGETYLQPPPTG